MSNINILKQIDMLADISIALSAERDLDILLEKILLCAKSISSADGGSLYQIENGCIVAKIIHSDSLKIHLGGSSRRAINLPKIALFLENQEIDYSHVVCYSYHTRSVVNIQDVYDQDAQFDFSGPKEFDRHYHYHTKSLLTIPLKNHKDEVIGVLQLVNALTPDTGEIIAFDAVAQKLTMAMAAQAAVALTQQQLILDLEKLFQSLVKLVATAIDQKSPYTGAHSRRVPILTMMIADAVHDQPDGYFKDFKLSSVDRNELEVAAWLHDCGKITTPEYVMDKATKLETIFDRIELIETRFEVLKRDLEISFLRNKIQALEQGLPWQAQDEQILTEKIAQIEADLTFIKHCNIGAESMTEADQARIRALAQSRWQLAGREQPLLTNDEIQNLCIYRGTLTDEERKVINHHIIATIDMLEAIDFPSYLKKVPEFAGGHHERMDGKGYPKGLRREQMSVQARIMGLADVFEALMDTDRPYKKGKKLSEALAILQNMKDTGHIDPDLHDVFMANKIYKKYADLYVDPDQVDLD